MSTRRQFLRAAGGLLGAAAVSKAALGAVPEAPIQTSPKTQGPLQPPNGRPYLPVVTLNGWTLPWRMHNGWKEFHLVAEPVVRELAPGMKANLWGYNGMLISVFELLADARQQIASVNAYIEALRDFWIADVNLELATTGRSPGAMQMGATSIRTSGDSTAGH